MNFTKPNNDPQNYYWWSEGFSQDELRKIYSDLESIPFQQATTIEVHALERFQDQETGLENNCLLPDLLPDCQLFHGLPDQHG